MKLTVTEFVSLDGVLQGPGSREEDTSGGFTRGGWFVPYLDQAFIRQAADWLGQADAGGERGIRRRCSRSGASYRYRFAAPPGSPYLLLPNGAALAAVEFKNPAFTSLANAKAWMGSQQYSQLKNMPTSLRYA